MLLGGTKKLQIILKDILFVLLLYLQIVLHKVSRWFVFGPYLRIMI